MSEPKAVAFPEDLPEDEIDELPDEEMPGDEDLRSLSEYLAESGTSRR